MVPEPRDRDDAEVRITYAESVGYSARHVESGVASQREIEEEALVALAEALALHRRADTDAEAPDAEWVEWHSLTPEDAAPAIRDSQISCSDECGVRFIRVSCHE